MEIVEAQREVRSVYLGGSIGQGVSGLIWLAAAGLGVWGTERQAILALVVGGCFIFPLTQAALKLLGRPASLSPQNPFRHLAMQVAFIVPLTLPVAGAATLYKLNWFFPACMILVGAHYLPFAFLYGMRRYLVLAALLIAGGLTLALYRADSFSTGGWFTGVALVVFGLGFAWRRLD